MLKDEQFTCGKSRSCGFVCKFQICPAPQVCHVEVHWIAAEFVCECENLGNSIPMLTIDSCVLCGDCHIATNTPKTFVIQSETQKQNLVHPVVSKLSAVLKVHRQLTVSVLADHRE